MRKTKQTLTFLLCLFLLWGCGSTKPDPSDPTAAPQISPTPVSNTIRTPLGPGS